MNEKENLNTPLICGDKVTWTSQALGSTKQKTGEIVAVIPAGTRPDEQRFKRLYTKGCGAARAKESYVVDVDGKPYWPVATKLTKIEPSSV